MTAFSAISPSSRRALLRGTGLTWLFLHMPLGCAAGGQDELVHKFIVGSTDDNGVTLEQILVRQAQDLGIQQAWHDSTAPDITDCRNSVVGRRLTRWDYVDGSSTNPLRYRFEVYDDRGELIGDDPSLTTILHPGYMVAVYEVEVETQFDETQVHEFDVVDDQDGVTLEDALRANASQHGIQLAWHETVAPDANDARDAVTGRRLVRWGYVEGSSTDPRHYKFEVYDDRGGLIGNEPTLGTVLHPGYTVVVLELSNSYFGGGWA